MTAAGTGESDATAAAEPAAIVVDLGAERADRREFHCTDLGNAERFVAQNGESVRYVPGMGWFAFDGQRWRRDADGEIMRRAKRTARSIYGEAEKTEHDGRRRELSKWALSSESESRLRDAVTLAQTEAELVATADQLDANPWLLNCSNGTVDLETGQLREHRRDDLITKLVPAGYDPDARSTAWTNFITRIMGDDSELAGFVQRAAGYSVSGVTREEVLFFCHGPSATGKSTFLSALNAVLGDYALTADFETFVKKSGDASIRSDIARMVGRRLVLSNEVDEGKALAEGMLKAFTGGDVITARHLYREHFEFTPIAKLWLAANARPKVNAADEAMWRRIIQIPFLQVIPVAERDLALKSALTRDPGIQSAILTWAVQGCLAWQHDGLNIPGVVREYTAEYRAENDGFGSWLAESAQLDALAFTTTSKLRGSYETWSSENGEATLKGTALATALKKSGCTQGKGGGARGWNGIRLV